MGTSERRKVGEENKRSHSRCQSEGGKGKADDRRRTTDDCRGCWYDTVRYRYLPYRRFAMQLKNSRTPRWSETQSHRLHVTYCQSVTLARLAG